MDNQNLTSPPSQMDVQNAHIGVINHVLVGMAGNCVDRIVINGDYSE